MLGVLITSCTASACASTPTPSMPLSGLTLSNLTPGSATLSWDTGGQAPAEGYGVYRGAADADDNQLSLIATTDDAQSYTATGLHTGTTYKFGVVALDVANHQSKMLTVIVTTPKIFDSTPPRPPSSSSLILSAFSASRIDLRWGTSPSSDVSSYEVLRDGKLVATLVSPSPQRYSDNGLSPASVHSYSIVAVDTSGNLSTPTGTKSAQTLAEGEVGIRRGPYVSNVTATTAIISWWSNIAAPGRISIAGRSVTDPHGALQHHAVEVTGLRPGINYPYSISTGQDSADGSFWTAAQPGQTFSFAALGDFGSGNSAEYETIAGIASAHTQFIQTVGDNVYPAAGLPDPNFTTTLSDFDTRAYRPLGPVLATQAFFPANGNKEYYAGGAFWANFPMPGKNHSWYSYDWGNAHILVLDTEQPFGPGSAQYQFARADLASHQKAAWRLVALQRPPYSSTTAYSSSTKAQQYLVPLFDTYRVSLVLAGNSHNYERSFPLTNGAPTKGDGVTYIVTGAGGNGFNRITAPQPAYSAFREDTAHEFVKVTVGPNQLVAEAVSGEDHAVIDRTTIQRRKDDTKPPAAPAGVVATRNTSSTVYLAWKPSVDNVGVTEYEIFRNGTTKPIATVSEPSFTQTALDPGTSFTYTVRAVDAAGNLSPSSHAAVAPPPGDLASPQDGPKHADPASAAKARGGCASGDSPQRVPAGGPAAAATTFAFRRRPRCHPAARPGPATN